MFSEDIVYKLQHSNSGDWGPVSKLQTERAYHQSVVVDNQLYLVGGVDQEGSLISDIEMVTRSKWMPEMKYGRSMFGMCSFAGFIFVAGGVNDGDFAVLDKCEVYRSDFYEWMQVASMNRKRTAFALVYFQQKIWAIGGSTELRTIFDDMET